jgi:serine/threonine-protein kinase RsbW
MLGLELLRPRARSKKISISSIPGEARRAEDAILPALSARGYGERALFAVKLALEEAVINSIRHGNQLDPTKKVRIEFTLDDDKAVISVADEGKGFDPASVPDPTLEENLEITAGRGLVLMRAYMDKVEFNEKANKVTMTKYAPWRRGQS